MAPARRFRFGIFEFDPHGHVLFRRGSTVALEPQPARVLALLLEHAGEVVSRDDVRARVWGADTHVDFDRGLAYCVSQLRAALGDSAENPRFIETLPRRGFRFIAPVTVDATREDETSPVSQTPQVLARVWARWVLWAATLAALGAAAWWARQPTADRVVVAVSVFDNESGDPRHDASMSVLADAVVERLAAPDLELAVVGNMPSVRAPRNARDLTRIRDETRGRFVVLGQLQRRDGRLSLLLQLIGLADGAHLWVDRIERPDGDDLAGVAADAAGRVAEAIRAALTGPS